MPESDPFMCRLDGSSVNVFPGLNSFITSAIEHGQENKRVLKTELILLQGMLVHLLRLDA